MYRYFIWGIYSKLNLISFLIKVIFHDRHFCIIYIFYYKFKEMCYVNSPILKASLFCIRNNFFSNKLVLRLFSNVMYYYWTIYINLCIDFFFLLTLFYLSLSVKFLTINVRVLNYCIEWDIFTFLIYVKILTKSFLN